jgi:transcription elongation factor/antiterminator RfaH
MLIGLGKGHCWYVVHCKSRLERFTANILCTLPGIFVFLPEYHMPQKKVIPFFPGYLFVQLDPEQGSFHRINSSPGVIRLVSFNGTPEPIASAVVERIYEKVTQLNAHQGNMPRFRTGEKVRIKQGPLSELELIFLSPTSSHERVRVLLSLLGRQKEVVIPAKTLEKMSLGERE